MTIFIEKWELADPDGRRDLKTKSKDTINGLHAYACKSLTSWFRLGEYVIKYNTVMYLLGLDKYIKSDPMFKHFVKYGNTNCIDEFVQIVNKHFDGDFIKTLLLLQEELMDEVGDECYFVSQCCHLKFDYKSFLTDKNKYLEDVRYKQEHREAR